MILRCNRLAFTASDTAEASGFEKVMFLTADDRPNFYENPIPRRAETKDLYQRQRASAMTSITSSQVDSIAAYATVFEVSISTNQSTVLEPFVLGTYRSITAVNGVRGAYEKQPVSGIGRGDRVSLGGRR